MKKIFSICFLIFLLIAIWIITSDAKNQIRTAKPFEQTLASIGITIPQPKTELPALIATARQASLDALIKYLEAPTRWGKWDKTKPATIPLILASLTTIQPYPGANLAYLATHYYGLMKQAEDKIQNVAHYFDPEPDQIYALVEAHLFPLFKEIDQALFSGVPVIPTIPTIPPPVPVVTITIQPKGLSIEKIKRSAHNASIAILIEHLANRGYRIQEPTIDRIFSLTAICPEPGKSIEFLREDYKNIMNQVYYELTDIRQYFSMNESQIEKLVRAKLQPLLEEINIYIK